MALFKNNKLDSVEATLAKIKERGYTMSDMEKTKEQIRTQWYDWDRNFSNYVDTLLMSEAGSNTEIIRRAEELADMRQNVLERRKPVGLD